MDDQLVSIEQSGQNAEQARDIAKGIIEQGREWFCGLIVLAKNRCGAADEIGAQHLVLHRKGFGFAGRAARQNLDLRVCRQISGQGGCGGFKSRNELCIHFAYDDGGGILFADAGEHLFLQLALRGHDDGRLHHLYVAHDACGRLKRIDHADRAPGADQRQKRRNRRRLAACDKDNRSVCWATAIINQTGQPIGKCVDFVPAVPAPLKFNRGIVRIFFKRGGGQLRKLVHLSSFFAGQLSSCSRSKAKRSIYCT